MQKNKSSETAEGVAVIRAMESSRPENDRGINDPYAKMFIGGKWLKWVKYPFLTWLFRNLGNIKYPGFRGSVIARVCFMNQCIKECFPGEFSQLVILGAGYDMSGYIFRDDLMGSKVFEVDHPDTQNLKRAGIVEHLNDCPDNIVYIPVDFETDDLKRSLLNHGYSRSEKTLFLWEGVSYYLKREIVEQTLDFVVDNSVAGSRLAFDFFPPEVADGTSNEKLGKEMYKLVNKLGEPYKFGIGKDQMLRLLKEHHYTNIQHYTAMDIKKTFFAEDRINKKVSSLFNFVCADTR